MRGVTLGIRTLSLMLVAASLGVWGGMAQSAGPTSGGVIHVATDAEPGTLDWTASTATATRLVAWHVYETLFALDRNYDVKPLLAEGYSVSADGLHYTIRLRKGITFHTGQPMKRIQEDTERDYIMSADQGKEYGIIDDVIRKRV